jgi:membrane-associated HD superfamily phosphohydrolase
MFSLLIVCTVCTGMLAGVIAAWLYFRPLRVVLTDRVETRDRRLEQMDAEIKAARGQIDAIQKENTALTAREAELAATLDHERQAAAERLSTARKTAEERLSAIEQATGRSLAAAERAAAERLLASEKASADQIVAVKSAAEERFAASQTAAQEKLALLEEARQKLSDAFQALSSEALKSNNQAFLHLAKETLEKHQVQAKGDLAVVYKLRALDCGRELPGIEPSSVIPLTVNNLEAKSAYRSRRFYPALMYDLDMRVALTPLSGPVPYAGVGVSAQ